MIATRLSLVALMASVYLVGCGGEAPKQAPKIDAAVKAKQDDAHAQAKKAQEESKAAEAK